MKTLSVLVLLILASALLGAAEARLGDEATVDAQAARAFDIVHSHGPYSDWNAFVPPSNSSHWHFAAADDRDPKRTIRRTGWLEIDGSQAGVAVCGGEQPELFSIAVHGTPEGQDGVLSALRDRGVEVEAFTNDGREFYRLAHPVAEQILERSVRCSTMAGPPMYCRVTYTLTVRPPSQEEPHVTTCPPR